MIGKNVTRTTTSTFGRSPNPNQTTISGAIATIGIVCEPDEQRLDRAAGDGTRSRAIAAPVAAAIETANPTSVSMIVGMAWWTARSRNSQSATGPGSATAGRTG